MSALAEKVHCCLFCLLPNYQSNKYSRDTIKLQQIAFYFLYTVDYSTRN